ncbi:MAG: hypothetical protein LBM77_01305 [Spirochaetaceae bacterium]|jgi:hypothetical protein|nr:hypothetical protein [Spirochaetaceae bacterium]
MPVAKQQITNEMIWMKLQILTNGLQELMEQKRREDESDLATAVRLYNVE